MPKNISKYFSPKNIFLAIFVFGFILRIVHPLSYFNYAHDQDLLGWIIKDILVNHHIRLIGQQTSSIGVFIGPLFYYLEIPFYLITKMDPIGSIAMPIMIGLFAVYSFYHVFSRIFNKKVGLIASFVYSISYFIVFFDREVAPTMPVMLWTVWYLYTLWLIYKGNSNGFVLAGFLFGLIWDLNLALLILAPLAIISQIFSGKSIEIKKLIFGIILMVVTLSPFLVFEGRHGFSQTRSIVASLTSNKDYSGGSTPGFAKLDRVMQLAYTNTTKLFWGFHFSPHILRYSFWILTISFLILVWRKMIPFKFSIILLLWQIMYILFFTVNSINVSEYYLNGMNVIWILIFSLGISYLVEGRFRYLGTFLMSTFLVLNLYSFLVHKTNGNGYVEKKSLIEFIKSDSITHGYPCVSISYITSPGYQFGYRYWLWKNGLKTKNPVKSGDVPIYSIVFPLSGVDRFDKNFGSIGVILPDYKQYNNKDISKACEGPDANLSEPMFGFTE